MVLERPTKEGESPVSEIGRRLAVSRVPRDTRNLVGSRGDHPPSLNTPWWPIAYSTVKERWKEPREGSEKNLKPCAYKHAKHVNVWCGTFCRMVRRVSLTSQVKCLRHAAVAKASLNRAYEVSWIRPETGWPSHVQAEVEVKLHGGPNPLMLKNHGMRCG